MEITQELLDASKVVTGESEFAAALADKSPSIYIGADITLTKVYTVNFDLYLFSSGYKILSTVTTVGASMLSITGGKTLVLENIRLDANNAQVTLFNVTSSHIVINEGVLMSNARRTAVKITNGSGVMNGGRITGIGTSSEAVNCTNSTFTMNSGSELGGNNTAGISLQNSTLNMTGDSKICGNKLLQSAGAVLCVFKSTVNMGLAEGDAPMVCNNISPGYSGGVYMEAGCVLNMAYDSSIHSNSAVTLGGGAGTSGGIINMSGNASIYGNSSGQQGGGVFLSANATLNMTDNAIIHSNNGLSGAGVLIKASTMQMSGNAAVMINTASENGGGVDIYDVQAVLSMSEGAKISENTAIVFGDGVYCAGTLNIQDDIRIEDGLYFTFGEEESDDGNERFWANVPYLTGALGGSAQIVIESSEYAVPSNIPLVIAMHSDCYPVLVTSDSYPFVLPSELNGYGARLSDDNTMVVVVANTYNISYRNYFACENCNPTSYVVADLPIALEPPVGIRVGYVFKYWVDPQGTVFDEIPKDVVGDLTLIAVWQSFALKHLLSFSATDPSISGTPFEMLMQAGTEYQIPSNPPVLSGYRFVGWQAYPDIFGGLVSPGQTITMPDSDLTLVTVWEEDFYNRRYNIRYDKNTSAVVYDMPRNTTVGAGQTVRLSCNIPVRTNYRFVEWNTQPDGSGTTYCPGQSTGILYHSLTLYAVWRRKNTGLGFNLFRS